MNWGACSTWKARKGGLCRSHFPAVSRERQSIFRSFFSFLLLAHFFIWRPEECAHCYSYNLLNFVVLFLRHSDVFWSLSFSLLDLLQRQVSSLVNTVFVRYGKKSFPYVIDCVQVHINSNIERCSQPCQTVTCRHIKFSLDEVEEISLD